METTTITFISGVKKISYQDKSDGLVAVEKLKWIPLAGLHVRFLPFLEDERIFHGKLEDSIEVNFYRTINEYDLNMPLLRETEYVRRRERMKKIKRFSQRMLPVDPFIKTRMLLFNSICRHGFKFRKRKGDQVKILMEPFWKTRYNLDSDRIVGPEIWNGVEVCAILYVLGEEKVKGLIMKDIYPGRKECARLSNIYKF